MVKKSLIVGKTFPPDIIFCIVGTVKEQLMLNLQTTVIKVLEKVVCLHYIVEKMSMEALLEICPRGNNKLVIIILYFIVHDNRLLSILELY